MRRANRGRLGAAVLASGVAHAGVLALFWLAAGTAEAIPDMRVYAVDIVSPPPQEAGEPVAGEPSPAEDPPVPEPVEEPEPEPEPAPPKPDPEPSEPPPDRRRPDPKPEPRRDPPAKDEPAPDPGRRSRGEEPDPRAESGENLTVKFDGVRCIEPDYCDNIIRQIHRYFRRPSGGSTGEADVYFVIAPNGSVEDLRVISSTGGLPFRLAVMEAVEQAGRNRAFGPLPPAFGGTLPVRFTFRPAR